MTLAKIIDTLKMFALKHPNINSAYEGNIYDILNAKPDNKYASVVLTQQSHTTDETYDHYGFVIFYVDRLVDDLEENRVQIQSIGKSMLGNIITAFCNEFEAECENISYQPFTQRFTDETAGVYCTITIDIVKDSYCAERYWDESWSAPIVSIKNVDMSLTITENGHYVLEYDPTTYTGIDKVDIDVNVDVDSYYNRGYGVGYDQGKVDGASEQKSKLETINITENGVYSNEDGYNHIEVNVPDLNGSYEEGYNQGYAEGEQVSYNTGYEQGQTDIAANARVLNVTENGIYGSKYTEPIIPDTVTGVYPDGTEFYDYAELNGKVFNTNIIPTHTTRLELWYRGDNTRAGDGWDMIIGSGKYDDGNVYQIRYYMTENNRISVELGTRALTYDWVENAWHHILIAKETEDATVLSLWVDEVKIGDFRDTPFSPQSTFYINGIESDSNRRRANGWFGMIKIDDTVIIPTGDGFLNTNTGELLEVVEEGNYLFTDAMPVYDGELYKTVNVNVLPKLDTVSLRVSFGYSTFDQVPQGLIDWSKVTNMNNMFRNCERLQSFTEDTSNVITMSYAFEKCSSLNYLDIDTSNVIDMSFAFYNCINYRSGIEKFNTSKVTNMQGTFYGCQFKEFPTIDTSNVTNMREMFENTYAHLKKVNPINTSKVTDMSYMFYDFSGRHVLEELPEFDCTKVTNMSSMFSYYQDRMEYFTTCGGWKNLKCNWDDNYGLRACANLSYESCINILNGLYDFVGNGSTETRKLKVHQNFLDTVGEEISIGTNKGWIITA